MDNIQRSDHPQFSDPKAASLAPEAQSKLAKSFWLRCVYIVLAWLCIVIALIGLFIPGLPPFDFLMLASFFAAKGSPKLHRWFMQNRFIGPVLREWQQHRRIPRTAKILSTISMSIAAAIIIWKIQHLWLVYALIFSMICVLIWMWRKA